MRKLLCIRGRHKTQVVFCVCVWTALLVSATGPGSQAADSVSDETREDVSKGEGVDDTYISYLLMGERMFRSRDTQTLPIAAREAFEKVLELDAQNAQAHYFLGLIEYEEGNIEKAKIRFRIAHECLAPLSEPLQLPVDAKEVQLEFANGYEAGVYYKDGWYVKSKSESTSPETSRPIDLLTLEAGSAYRIKLTPERRKSWIPRSVIGLILSLSFLMAR